MYGIASIELLIKDHPQRSFALKTSTHVLVLRHLPTHSEHTDFAFKENAPAPRCIVEFTALEAADLEGYRSLRGVALNLKVHGTLGLITIENDVFLCVVSAVSTRPIVIRPGETVRKIEAVDFHCLNSSSYDRLLSEQNYQYYTDHGDALGFDERGEAGIVEHPCLALKKLLGGGTFYYSSDFDLTRRLQKRITDDGPSISVESFDAGFLWNSYMIKPITDFRSRLSSREKDAMDSSRIITSAIRGFCNEITIPSSASPLQNGGYHTPARLTLISRLSCRRAGTRFNARGMDDEGNVANYVETETSFWSPRGEDEGDCFSYVQVRGSLPVFWEQPSSLIPGQPKITITRSIEATQPSFDKHFETMDHSYGVVHVLNLLSNDGSKPGEIELTNRYEDHIAQSPLNKVDEDAESERQLLKYTHYDFHAETRGAKGYEAARGISRYIQSSAKSFGYLYAEDKEHRIQGRPGQDYSIVRKAEPIMSQEGVFRTNCLDCLDRTNLIQTFVSQMALEYFLEDRGVRPGQHFWAYHGTLWADNGDALSNIYTNTGALKTTYTRSGKQSLLGAMADGIKSVRRHVEGNFFDKGRQDTIDLLLGRMMKQRPVHLFDPINDWVQLELKRRAPEYSSTKMIRMLVATFNLNAKTRGLEEDLSPWLCPPMNTSQSNPEIVAVALQEMVELNPNNMMKEDPYRRQQWELVIKQTLNTNAAQSGGEEYILLRSGQLVGAALLIFVRMSVLSSIKNVEGAIKKTGINGMAGNKGAVAIRMDFNNTSLCFVTAHLAAGFSNQEERHKDYRTISNGLRFQRNRSIDQHDSVIWAGDFNYRIGLSNEKVRHLIDRGDLDTLLDNDQLYIARTRSAQHDVFDHYDEAKITFLPTYKYDIGTDVYDTSEKARIPAWTDRILRKGNNIRQIDYNAAPLKFSDHRPVYATFQCIVNVVDESHRARLSGQLYAKRKAAIGNRTATEVAEATSDDEDFLGDEPTESDWPPPSSDRHKWWLENGIPAQSTLEPPGDGFVPNPRRTPNPFAPSDELDWIKVDKPSRPSSIASRPGRSLPTQNDSETGPRLPPRRAIQATSKAVASREPPQIPTRTPSVSSTSSTLRKPAPPIPKKPIALSTPASPTVEVPSSITRQRSILTGKQAASSPLVPPPPRHSMTPTRHNSMSITSSSLSSPSQRRTSTSTFPSSSSTTITTTPSRQASYNALKNGGAIANPLHPPPPSSSSSSASPFLPPRRSNTGPISVSALTPVSSSVNGNGNGNRNGHGNGHASSGGGGNSSGHDANTALMDERDEDGLNGLRDWEVLRPS